MTRQEFAQKYKGRQNLYGISWNDFPAELQEACQRFIDEWKENLYIDDLRNLSGFNEMSVEDLLRYVKGKLPEDEKPLGSPYKR